jgi:hypothetical protein
MDGWRCRVINFPIRGLREECALLTGASTVLNLSLVLSERDEAEVARFLEIDLAAREILHATTPTPHHKLPHHIYSILRPPLELESRFLATRLPTYPSYLVASKSCDTSSDLLQNGSTSPYLPLARSSPRR